MFDWLTQVWTRDRDDIILEIVTVPDGNNIPGSLDGIKGDQRGDALGFVVQGAGSIAGVVWDSPKMHGTGVDIVPYDQLVLIDRDFCLHGIRVSLRVPLSQGTDDTSRAIVASFSVHMRPVFEREPHLGKQVCPESQLSFETSWSASTMTTRPTNSASC